MSQDVDEGAVDAAEKTEANSKERFEQIYQAVRYGALGHDLAMSNDMMFLCERIAELESQSEATGKRAAVYVQNSIELQARVEELESEKHAAQRQGEIYRQETVRWQRAVKRIEADRDALASPTDVAAYLLDRADQYDLDGGFWVALADCAKAIASGAVEAAKAHGELDASLYERLATMNDEQTYEGTDEQLADIERRIAHGRIQRGVRAELRASSVAELAESPPAPIPMSDERQKNVDLVVRYMFELDVDKSDVYRARLALGLLDYPPNARGWVDVAEGVKARWDEEHLVAMSDEQPKATTDDMRKRQRYAIAGITDLLNEFDLPEHCADAGECLRKIGVYVLMGLGES